MTDLAAYTIQLRHSDGSDYSTDPHYPQVYTILQNHCQSLADNINSFLQANRPDLSVSVEIDSPEDGIVMQLSTTRNPPANGNQSPNWQTWLNGVAQATSAFDTKMDSFVANANQALANQGHPEYVVIEG